VTMAIHLQHKHVSYAHNNNNNRGLIIIIIIIIIIQTFVTRTVSANILTLRRVPVVTLSGPWSPVLYRSPCLGLYRSLERLSDSDVDTDDGCSLHSIHSYGIKPFLSFNCKYCTFHYGVCLRS